MKRLNNVSKKNKFKLFDIVSKKEQIRFKRLIIKKTRKRTFNNEHTKINIAWAEAEVRRIAGETKIEWS